MRTSTNSRWQLISISGAILSDVWRKGGAPLIQDRSLTGSQSDDPACLVPTLLTGFPEPFHVALGTPWVGDTTQSSYSAGFRGWW